MDALEMLYDHYKETFCLSKEAQARRNKSFIVLCILEAFSFLLLIRPEKTRVKFEKSVDIPGGIVYDYICNN